MDFSDIFWQGWRLSSFCFRSELEGVMRQPLASLVLLATAAIVASLQLDGSPQTSTQLRQLLNQLRDDLTLQLQRSHSHNRDAKPEKRGFAEKRTVPEPQFLPFALGRFGSERWSPRKRGFGDRKRSNAEVMASGVRRSAMREVERISQISDKKDMPSLPWRLWALVQEQRSSPVALQAADDNSVFDYVMWRCLIRSNSSLGFEAHCWRYFTAPRHPSQKWDF